MIVSSPAHPKQQQRHACPDHTGQTHQLVLDWHPFTVYQIITVHRQAKRRRAFSSIKGTHVHYHQNAIFTNHILLQELKFKENKKIIKISQSISVSTTN